MNNYKHESTGWYYFACRKMGGLRYIRIKRRSSELSGYELTTGRQVLLWSLRNRGLRCDTNYPKLTVHYISGLKLSYIHFSKREIKNNKLMMPGVCSPSTKKQTEWGKPWMSSQLATTCFITLGLAEAYTTRYPRAAQNFTSSTEFCRSFEFEPEATPIFSWPVCFSLNVFRYLCICIRHYFVSFLSLHPKKSTYLLTYCLCNDSSQLSFSCFFVSNDTISHVTYQRRFFFNWLVFEWVQWNK